jgi:ABC-type nitrate/sulfonate/bicarbonate transport system, permease component
MRIVAICFWLLAWEGLSRSLANDILLPSPIAVMQSLMKLVVSSEFWQTILFSSLRIIIGFLLALIIGMLLALISYRNRFIKELFMPFMKTIQAMPVASFIILALVWIHSKNLSVLTSFLMVMPLVYSNVLQGLLSADQKLLQMAKVFRLNRRKKIMAIYLPSITPFFVSAISVGIGLCWKAGIAAEVIGIPIGSIGQHLYEAKLNLMIKELFAWTIVIIVISILFEKAVMQLLQLLHKDVAANKKTSE